MQNISVMITAFILLSASLTITANAQDIVDRTPSPAAVHDLRGNLLDQITAGQQVILSKSFVDSRNVPQPFVAIFEIRDSNGFTMYLTWQSGTTATSGQVNVSASWTAEDIGIYEVRTFFLSDLTNPVVLDEVWSRSIPVVEGEAGA